jgi:NADH-quinone oxidoreductase subunit N
MDPSAFSGLRFLAPEIALLAAAVLSLLLYVFLRRRGARVAGAAALAGVAVAFLNLVLAPPSAGQIFSGNLVVDPFAIFIKAAVLLATALSLLLSIRFFSAEEYEPGEVYPLILLASVGMMMTVAGVDLIATYVSFELFAITSYVLAGIFKKERRSAEAGIKYFFLGSLSSGIMILGMAVVYGLSGETQYAGIARALEGADGPLALTGMLLFFSGLFFKAAFVPFHMWAPDVYEGAPTPVTVFLSTASKAAVLGVLIRAMTSLFGRFEPQWSAIFLVLALITMFWGNIAALLQDNMKRMMAYSSIAHAGYVAIGLAAWGEEARTAVLFYVFLYVFMNAAAFTFVLLVRKPAGFGENVSDLRGLAKSSPLTAACIVIVLLSLTGIPPTAGFMGKYFLLAAAVNKKLYLLAAAGALNSVISLFYYFRIGRAMFMEEAEDTAPAPLPSGPVIAVLVLSALVLLGLGILPSILAEFAANSVLGN